jgi:multidrug efflux system outer membrane protein
MEIAVATNYPPVPPPVRAGLPLSLLERHPDLLAAQSQVLASFRREEAARLALLPSFTLGVKGGRLARRLRQLPWFRRGWIRWLPRQVPKVK